MQSPIYFWQRSDNNNLLIIEVFLLYSISIVDKNEVSQHIVMYNDSCLDLELI